MSRRFFGRILGATLFVLGIGFALGLVHAAPAAAAGETYTWKDYRTIVVSGGDTRGNDTQWNFNEIYLAVDEGGPGLQGDQIGKFGGALLLNKGPGNKCYFDVTIYVYKGNVQGMIWHPPPYGQGQSAVPQGYPANCEYSKDLAGFLESNYHNKYIDLKGTRPTNPNAPERDDEKRFDVYVFAPDPLSKVPASDTISIYKSDGTKVAEQSSPFKDDSGAANWPPDQTPASLQVTFKLEPGDYLVCDTYVAKECTYAKVPAEQKFKKVKYKTGSIEIGKQFQTPDKKRINVHVNYHTKAPCGSTVDVSPLTVELTGPTGDKSKVVDQQTNAGHAGANLPGESGSLCTKDVTVGMDTTFEDMAPGEYKFCTTGAECVTATKVDGEPLEVTLEVTTEQTAPPDQKVCTSGDGVAGALAWIICPATQLIASATDFFENNIIIPFLTVSPLTTNGNNPIYILWQDFRDLANVGFIILLFISIFSIALSKYGLKRVLPRLLIVAIGINLSYFVVAFVVDAFNIFGSGISQLVMSALQQAGTTQLNTGTSAGAVRSIFTLGGAALLTILITGGAALGWLFSFLGIALLVVVIVVIILIVRQMAIITLVVLSPLAILMYLLPNTEGYFKKWRQMLIQLLMMYPMIVLLFASGKVFGIILQQPDFKIAGDGISDEVAQGVRVILQFLVYVIPLVFLPATFAASGSLMSRAYSFANNRRLRQAAQRPGKAFGENVVKPARQEMQMRAARRGGRIGQLAGYSMRRDFKKEQRERELGRARQEYMAGRAMDNNFAGSAAGIGGESGRMRVQAGAQALLEKAESEDLKNASALLTRTLQSINMDERTFANQHLSAYLDDPAGKAEVKDGAGRTVFNFKDHPELLKAALSSAAQQGEITTMEKARTSSLLGNAGGQAMLDDVMRRNDGALKSTGGYHLATDFSLGNSRMQTDVNGAPISSNPAVAKQQMTMKLQQARLNMLSQTGAGSIAGMKGTLIEDTANILDPSKNPQAAQLLASLSTQQRDAIRDRMDSIISTPSTLNKSEAPESIRAIRRLI